MHSIRTVNTNNNRIIVNQRYLKGVSGEGQIGVKYRIKSGESVGLDMWILDAPVCTWWLRQQADEIMWGDDVVRKENRTKSGSW